MRKTIQSIALAVAISSTAYADSNLIVTVAGGAGAFNSTLSGVSVENFSGYSAGVYNNINWSGVGTIDQVSLIPNSQFGGTPSSTIYSVESTANLGGTSAVSKSTLSLNNSVSYFGLYWSAGDSGNVLDFYNGNNLVAHFTTANLLSYLPSSYNGNPNAANKGQDSGEKFAFVNFYAGQGTTFNKVVFSNLSTSGFETQNWTVRTAAYNPATDGAIAGTPLIEVKTTGGVTTQSQIASLLYDGSTISYTTTNGTTTAFASATGGSTYTSYGYSASGTSLGVVKNPEPSVYLTFAMMSILLLMGSRRKLA